MRLIFGGKSLDCCNTLLNIMINLKSYGILGEKIINSIVYEEEFSSIWIRTLDALYPNLDLIANSFLQINTVEQIALSGIDIFIQTNDELDEEYLTGNLYLGVYKYLKKNHISNVFLNEKLYLSKENNLESITKSTK